MRWTINFISSTGRVLLGHHHTELGSCTYHHLLVQGRQTLLDVALWGLKKSSDVSLLLSSLSNSLPFPDITVVCKKTHRNQIKTIIVHLKNIYTPPPIYQNTTNYSDKDTKGQLWKRKISFILNKGKSTIVLSLQKWNLRNLSNLLF